MALAAGRGWYGIACLSNKPASLADGAICAVPHSCLRPGVCASSFSFRPDRVYDLAVSGHLLVCTPYPVRAVLLRCEVHLEQDDDAAEFGATELDGSLLQSHQRQRNRESETETETEARGQRVCLYGVSRIPYGKC